MTGASELARALFLAACVCACGSPASLPVMHATPSPAAADAIQSIVIIDADGTDMDPAAPWGTGKSWSRSLTGLAIEGRQILVGGWGLRGRQHVRAERPGTTLRSDARVIYADEDRGLTLLGVDDPAFWDGLPAAPVPDGIGAQGLSRTLHATKVGTGVDAAVVSVLGVHGWGRGWFPHLKLQGDPSHVVPSDVLSTKAMAIGIVVSNANGEIMAVTSKSIVAFLADAKRSTGRGYPVLGVSTQPMTSHALREELGLVPADGGMRITRVFANGSGAGVLSAGDVVLTIDGKKVDKDGTCSRAGAGRAWCPAIVFEGHRPGDTIEVGILRDGARKSVNITLRTCATADDLVPYRGRPEQGIGYDVEGGLVFENLTGEYLGVSAKDWERKAPRRLAETYLLDAVDATEERRHVVVLTRVLADPATLGYQNLRDLIVETIDGVRLRSVEDVRGAFAHPTGAFHVITFAPGQGVSRIVLDAAEAEAANGRLRATYSSTNGGNGG